MKIYKTIGIVKAEAVLGYLQMLLVDDNTPNWQDSDEYMHVESYQNGREQGLLFWPMFCSDKAFYVCQPRGTDGIVVYYGSYSMQSISEDAYQNGTYFKEGEERQAAQFILEESIKLLVASKKKKNEKS